MLNDRAGLIIYILIGGPLVTVLNLNTARENPPKFCQSFASQNPKRTSHRLPSAGSWNIDAAALTRLTNTFEIPVGKIIFFRVQKHWEE